MTLDTSFGALANAASGVIIATLGVWLLQRRPRPRANLWMGLFFLFFGLAFLPNNLVLPDGSRLTLAARLLESMLFGAALVGLLGVYHTVPTRARGAHLRSVRATLGVLAALAVVAAMETARIRGWLAEALFGAGTTGPVEATAVVLGAVTFPTIPGVVLLLVVWAARAHWFQMEGRAARARECALLAAGFAPFIGITGGAWLVNTFSIPGVAWRTIAAGAAAMALAAWVLVAVRHPGPLRRWSWTVVAGMVTGAALQVAIADSSIGGPSGPHWGISRMVGLGVLAYAVLRHQLLGIDLKVKWTIKQSTLAGIFIATFFVVSEGAAALFEAQTGSTWAGILAAGALVFAIAPLQRFAERVSDKAMPGVKPVGEMDEGERLAIYHRMASAAWADGAVDRSERAMLDELREELGLGTDVTAAIETEAADAGGGVRG